MSKDFSLEEFDAQLVATTEAADNRPSRDAPFRLALIGNWGGHANRDHLASSEEIASRGPLRIDRDSLDDVMARLGVSLQLSATGDLQHAVTIDFRALSDFHPDRLFAELEIFNAWRQARTGLNDPRTFAAAAAAVQGWDDTGMRAVAKPLPVTATADVPDRPQPVGDAGSLLDQILAGTTDDAVPRRDSAPEVSPEIGALAKQAVHQFLTVDHETERKQLLAKVDARISGTMNAILHHPDFQALEAAWRALEFLVKRLETGTELKLYLLDISFDEFKMDLRSERDFRTSGIYKLLVEQTVGMPGALPWSAIAADYTFDFDGFDPGLIERISLIAREADAPFIAAAAGGLIGSKSLVEASDPTDWRVPSEVDLWWTKLRSLPSVAYVGLALPRFLLRLPYGKETEPTDGLDFEEMSGGDESSASLAGEHEFYLWGNPAFAVAYVLAKGFTEGGWAFSPTDFLDIEGLPMHIREYHGESEIKPGAEVFLTLRAAQTIISRGLMPLLSMKNSDSIRLGAFQSIAGTALSGPWQQE